MQSTVVKDHLRSLARAGLSLAVAENVVRAGQEMLLPKAVIEIDTVIADTGLMSRALSVSNQYDVPPAYVIALFICRTQRRGEAM